MTDSPRFQQLQNDSVRDVKAVGMTSAGTSLELIGYIRELESLIQHSWVHSGYHNCGTNQMTSEQKQTFDQIVKALNEDELK